MEIKIKIPQYSVDSGLKFNWEEGFDIETKIKNEVTIITANKEGLISLARHFLMLAQDEVPIGSHIHFDEYNSLENGSSELMIGKK